MDLSYIGSKHGEPVEGDTQPRILSEELIEKKKEEYVKKTLDLVWRRVLEDEPNKYGILQSGLKMERNPDEYNNISDRVSQILEELIDHVKKQIYIDTYELDGELFPADKDPIKMSDFSKVVDDYTNDLIERIITDELTQSSINEFGEIVN